MSAADRKFMASAIDEAKKSDEPIVCGAVIAKSGKVIAKAYSTARKSNNASAHAEINAMRKAGRRLGSKYLDRRAIYSTLEPCVMCLAAISFSKIDRIIYGVSLRSAFPRERIFSIDINLILSRSPHKIRVTRNFMEAECRSLLSFRPHNSRK